MKVFDIHQHLGSLGEPNIPDVPLETDEDAERRISVMRQHGMTAAAVLPPPVYDRTDGWRSTRALNTQLAGFRDRHPESFPAAFGVVEPMYSLKSGLEEIAFMRDEARLNGVVWHHKFHGGIAMDAPVMDRLVEASHEAGLRILVHVYADSPLESVWSLLRLARRHPEVPFVALDAFSSAGQARDLPTVADECPNVLFETAGTFPLGRLVERFVKAFGSHRVVYGSQLYARPQWWLDPHTLTELRASPDLKPEDLENILWRNAAELLGLTDGRDARGS